MEPQQQSGGQLPPPQTPQQPPQHQQPVSNHVPTPLHPGHDPYEFIMNPQKPPKKVPLLSGSSSSLPMRIAIAGGGVLVLIILAVVVSSLLSSGGSKAKDDMLSVAADQTELIRVATSGTQNASSLATQSLAQNILLSVTSQRTQLLAYLEDNGQKPSTAQLAATRSKNDDTTLTNAKASDTYDSSFTVIIQADLANYQQALKRAYDANPGPKGRTLLSKQYDAADLLGQQSTQGS